MDYTKQGFPIVKNLDDLKESLKTDSFYVYAICPKCEEGWTSIYPNAKNIIENGCLCCVEEKDEWTPKIGII